MKRAVVFGFLLVFASAAAGQDSIRWKGNRASGAFRPPMRQKDPLRTHLVVEFAAPPSFDDIAQLQERGAAVLGPLSDRALVISVPLGFVTASPQVNERIKWMGSFAAKNKISPLIQMSSGRRARAGQDPYFVVEFDPA